MKVIIGMVQVVPCLAIFDTMKYIGSDVGTVGFGGCMGMSGFLLAVGKKVSSLLTTLLRQISGITAAVTWRPALNSPVTCCSDDRLASVDQLSRSCGAVRY